MHLTQFIHLYKQVFTNYAPTRISDADLFYMFTKVDPLLNT